VKLKLVFKNKYGGKGLYCNRTHFIAKSENKFMNFSTFITPKYFTTKNTFPRNALNKRQQTAYSRDRYTF